MTSDVEEWAFRAASLLAALGIPARTGDVARVTLTFDGHDMRGPDLRSDAVALLALAECCTALGWRCTMPDFEVIGDGWTVPADPKISIGEALARALDAHVRGA